MNCTLIREDAVLKKAVVTGANGFVGTVLCRCLSAKGIEVIAVVRKESSDVSSIQALEGLRIVYCEMSDYYRLDRIIIDRDVDVFYHLAWEGSSGELRGDDRVQIKNVQHSCDIMKACSAIGCRRFVFASSIMEYEVSALMDGEEAPPVNTLYCSAKAAANHMLRTLAAANKISYIRAVISNIYGPGEKNLRLVNASIRKMLRGERCAFSPGDQMYDFVYADDAAGAMAAIGEKGVSNRSYYIGSLHPRPLKEFLAEMAHEVNPDLEIGLGELDFRGISLTYHEFDIEAVKNDTGFEPKIDFAEGIRRTIQWISREMDI